MSMTRKDYLKMAQGLARARAAHDNQLSEWNLRGYDAAVDALCDVLELDNPKFDRERFIDVVQGFDPPGPGIPR